MSGGQKILAIIGLIAVVGGITIFLVRRGGLNEKPTSSAKPRSGDVADPVAVKTHQVSRLHWTVSNLDREIHFKDIKKATGQVRFKPEPGEEKDSVTHLTLLKLDPDSPMYAAGFRKGDLIMKVNGTPIGTMGRAINLVHEIKAADQVTVEVKRSGEVVNYRFDFR